MPNDPLGEETVEGSGGTATPIIKRKRKNVRKGFLNGVFTSVLKIGTNRSMSNSSIDDIFDFDLIIVR